MDIGSVHDIGDGTAIFRSESLDAFIISHGHYQTTCRNYWST